MPFVPCQIVGLIEIDSLDSAGSDNLHSAGQEEDSLFEMFSWLALRAAASPPSDPAGAFPGAAPPAHRLSAVLGLGGECLPADLAQLQLDLVAATAKVRLRLAA